MELTKVGVVPGGLLLFRGPKGERVYLATRTPHHDVPSTTTLAALRAYAPLPDCLVVKPPTPRRPTER